MVEIFKMIDISILSFLTHYEIYNSMSPTTRILRNVSINE